jgi:hypothetical protein
MRTTSTATTARARGTWGERMSATTKEPRRHGMMDVHRHPIQIRVSADGKTLWVNDAERCLLRAQDIPELVIEDERPESRVLA